MLKNDGEKSLNRLNNISIEEKIYENYISMKKQILDYDNFKYENLDPYINSADFKAGFLAGVKTILLLTINKD